MPCIPIIVPASFLGLSVLHIVAGYLNHLQHQVLRVLRLNNLVSGSQLGQSLFFLFKKIRRGRVGVDRWA